MIPRPPDVDELPPRARITLRKNSTGETRTFIEDWTVYEGSLDCGSLWWMWAEGNCSCDCNRHLRFDASGDEEIPCRDEEMGDNRYTLIGFEPLPIGE